MTRLIDAHTLLDDLDAAYAETEVFLNERYELDPPGAAFVGWTEVLRAVNSAPTVRCAVCGYLDSDGDDTWVCACADSPTDGMEIPDPSVEACSNFKRRQP